MLPPGPISNDDLFDGKHRLKKGLKKVEHYRGVNKQVWETYLQIYGGGPVIERRYLDIYQ